MSEDFDMFEMLASARDIQTKMADLQAQVFTGSAGGGLVSVEVTGESALQSVQIKPEAVDLDDLDGLGDLIVAAYRDASVKVKDRIAEIMPTMPDMGQLGF
jgi:DNA-binding YbaB/EbfC family protein